MSRGPSRQQDQLLAAIGDASVSLLVLDHGFQAVSAMDSFKSASLFVSVNAVSWVYPKGQGFDAGRVQRQATLRAAKSLERLGLVQVVSRTAEAWFGETRRPIGQRMHPSFIALSPAGHDRLVALGWVRPAVDHTDPRHQDIMSKAGGDPWGGRVWLGLRGNRPRFGDWVYRDF